MDDRLKSRTVLLIKILIVLCLLAAIVFILVDSRVAKTEYTGSSMYTDEELDTYLFRDRTDRFTFLFYLKYLIGKTPEIPCVEKIEVELVNSRSLRITVHERALAGCVVEMGRYFIFDRTGTVVESSSVRPQGVPMIRGIDLDRIVVGEKLAATRHALFDTVLSITLKLGEYDIDASLIEFSDRNEVSVTVDDDIILLGSSQDFGLRIANIPAVLAGIPEGSYKLDMRGYDEEHREVYARKYD